MKRSPKGNGTAKLHNWLRINIPLKSLTWTILCNTFFSHPVSSKSQSWKQITFILLTLSYASFEPRPLRNTIGHKNDQALENFQENWICKIFFISDKHARLPKKIRISNVCFSFLLPEMQFFSQILKQNHFHLFFLTE